MRGTPALFQSSVHPPEAPGNHVDILLVPMEDGSLGLARFLCTRLCLWSRNADPEVVVARWVQLRDIDILTRVPFWSSVELAGSTQGFGTIFVVTDVGVFAMELESGDVRKVGKPRKHLTIFPFMSFFTPGIVLATLLRCNPALYFCTFA